MPREDPARWNGAWLHTRLFTSKIKKIKKNKTASSLFDFLRTCHTFYFFYKKKRQKMLRALVTAIKCIGFINKQNFCPKKRTLLFVS